MKVIRKPLRKGEGRLKSVAGYDRIGWSMGCELVDRLAKDEVKQRTDVSNVIVSNREHPDDTNRIQHVAVLIGDDRNPICEFYSSWPKVRIN